MMLFKDRQSAGKILAKRLNKYRNQKDVLVLGIPRGGVVVAHKLAKTLNLPLDIIVTRKIGAPMQKELALGAVDSDGMVVWSRDLIDEQGILTEDLESIVGEEVEEIRRREKVYRGTRKPLEVKGRIIILADDGIATGATTISAINYLKRHEAKKLVLAVPVASIDAKEKLSKIADELVILETPQYFQAVGQFYQEFKEVTDEEVIQLLSSPT